MCEMGAKVPRARGSRTRREMWGGGGHDGCKTVEGDGWDKT